MNIIRRHSKRHSKRHFILLIIAVLLLVSGWQVRAGQDETAKAEETAKRPMTVLDMMKFRQIRHSTISDDGLWITYTEKPDRGNSEVVVYKPDQSGEPFKRIERGQQGVFSKDARWLAALIDPDALDKANKKKDLKTGLMLLNTQTGETVTWEKVKSFVFSKDSQWLVYRCFPEKKKKDKKEQDKKEVKEEEKTVEKTEEKIEKKVEEKKEEKEDKKKAEDKWAKKSYPIVLYHLATGKEVRVPKVIYYALDHSSRYFAYSVYDAENNGNGLFVRQLTKEGAPQRTVHAEPEALYTNLTWSKTKSRLGFIFHRNRAEFEKIKQEKKKKKKGKQVSEKLYTSGLVVWDGVSRRRFIAVPKGNIPPGWMIPAENKLEWTEDGERLFFGFKPYNEYKMTLNSNGKKKKEEVTSVFDVKQILDGRGVDVWHYKDPKLITQQKKDWEKFRKQVYFAVYHYRQNQFILLTDKLMPRIKIAQNPSNVLGFSTIPYRREATWADWYQDVYLCDLDSGFRRRLATHIPRYNTVSLSPGGRYAVYYNDKHWYLYNVKKRIPRRLTENIETPFYNEDHDYPRPANGYGMAGWTEKDQSVIIYDKYDIWEFDTRSDKFTCLTGGQGRANHMIYRVQETDPEFKFFKKNETLLLTGHSEEEKFTGFYSAAIGQSGVKTLLEEKNKTLTFRKKAKNADKIIFNRENFQEFPDIWMSDLSFTAPQKITHANPQMKDLLWGSAELLRWKSLDGVPLKGVVIKPENYDPNKRYPVLIYFYRIVSHRLHRFNQVVVNHRPCFPFYSGNGYVIFLPDIRFDIGHPGRSAYKCIVPGVQELIDRGIADPKAVGIHGHSWGGYQTAHIITETDMFAAAIAGAPVSNMTSAYSGIRWHSGMARQFQYEQGQSRIGASLFEKPELYIENSPVFHAEKIKTPLLIQFGDKDGAVPWYQGIELYLAMRRFDKDCIFLQYNDEPHHLKKYPNKLDYTLKMKQYLDHYLKGEPAAQWIENSTPYVKK